MTWPGEGLLIKLWETLAEKGVGGLLSPWQIKREAKAHIEARRIEIVALADAEREAEEIRAGRLKLEDSRYTLALPAPDRVGSNRRIEPTIDRPNPIALATANVVSDSLRREVNVAKAITYAEEELKDDALKPPERSIEDDWLFRWRDAAGTVSSDELQSLWGRLLAGELKSPGSYSYRTLEFVKNLTTPEAKLIERLSPFVITNFIARNQRDVLEAQGVSFGQLMELQDIGIISGVESLGLSLRLNSMEKGRFVNALRCHGRALIVTHADPAKELKIQAYFLTNIGQQVMRLGRFNANEPYLRAVGEEFKKAGATVSIAQYRDISEDEFQVFNEQSI